ncbi:MAG: hypothetical protein GY696_34725, partial [Gammaproteobacteria bacterium]|nr:hypothetical protein [Gammaproteobacteria bacterium]
LFLFARAANPAKTPGFSKYELVFDSLPDVFNILLTLSEGCGDSARFARSRNIWEHISWEIWGWGYFLDNLGLETFLGKSEDSYFFSLESAFCSAI